MNGAPPLRVLVAALVAFVVLVAAVVTVLVSSPQLQAQASALLAAHAGAVATALVAAVPACAAWLNGRKVRATQADHADQLDQITAQTNGVLDKRIRDGVRAELVNAGLVVGDTPAGVVPVVIPDQPTAASVS